MKKLTEKEKDKLLEVYDRILGEAIDTITDCMDKKEKLLYARYQKDIEFYNDILENE